MEVQRETVPSTRRVVAIQRGYEMSPYMEDPAKTPHLAATPRSNEDNSPSYAACIENGTREIGVAMLRLHPPSLSLYQFSDTSMYSYLNNILDATSPKKILVVSSQSKSALTQIVIEKYDDSMIVSIPRAQFSDSKGVNLINELSNSPNEIFGTTPIKNRYLCISASAAVLQYAMVEEEIQIYPSSLRTIFHTLDGHMMIDPIALINFNIITAPRNSILRLQTSKKLSAAPSLFNFIDRCMTSCGERFLRATVASPPCDPRHISMRYDFINELMYNEELIKEIQKVLKGIQDLDPVISFLVTKQARKTTLSFPLDCILKLVKVCNIAGSLREALSKMSCNLSQGLLAAINESHIEKISEILSDFVDDDDDKNKFLYCIAEGKLALLDVTRKTYERTLEQIFHLPQDLQDRHGIKCQIKFNKTRRYHLQIKKSDVVKKSSSIISSSNNEGLPTEFIFATKSDSVISCTTQELLILNKANESAESDAIIIAQKFAESKIDAIRSYISSIYSISEVIGFLDTLLSLAIVSNEMKSTTRPKLNSNSLSLVNARHPILERLYQNNIADDISKLTLGVNTKAEFIPTSISLTPVKKISILSGVNASGKSTLLQTVCLNTIMAQCGCFVPCEEMSLPVIQSIFVKCTSPADYIESGTSSFKREMMELSNIALHSDQNSLVLIDEPCASTSSADGSALAWVLCEKLLLNKSFAVVSTHFRELEMLSQTYNNVQTNQMQTEVGSDGRFLYKYKCSNGSLSENAYGIRSAEGILPPDVISHARIIYENISQQKPVGTKSQGKNAAAALIQKILNLRETSLDDDGLRACLTSIKKRCIIK